MSTPQDSATEEVAPPRSRTSAAWGLVALFLTALSLRPNLVGVGPLLPQIQVTFGTSYQVVGLAMSIPLVCMGLFAVPAAAVGRRAGAANALAACLFTIGVFGILRALSPAPWMLLGATVPMGVAMGLAGPMMAVLVKEQHAGRPAFGTGVYSTGLQVGATGGVALAIPLSLWLGGWRQALIVLSVVALLSGASRSLIGAPSRRSPGGSSLWAVSTWRDPKAWWLALIFWLTALPFFGLVAWMTAAYVEAGWDATRAGLLTSLLGLIGMPCSVVVGLAADRFGSRRAYLTGTSVALTVGTVGLAAHPAGAWVWAVVTGGALGALLTLALTLPLDVADEPLRVGEYATVMLFAGYLLTAVTPSALGALRDLTGSFALSMWTVAAGAGLLVVACLFSNRMLRPEAQRGRR